MVVLKLFEVAGAGEAFRPSLYCWRTRMALRHKGLAFQPVPWRAVEKDRIAASGGRTVPVLVDGERWIGEPWEAARYLDECFPDSPPLFDGSGDRAKARLLDHWTTGVLHPLMFRAVVGDMLPKLAAEDQDFYRERTLRKYGRSVEALASDPAAAVLELRQGLMPLEKALADTRFLGGCRAIYGNYLLFGAFQWARVASERVLLKPKSATEDWFNRLLDAFDGFGRARSARAAWD